MFSLKGKVALVTGGAGILGRHFCRALAVQGADVVIADLDGQAATSLAEVLENEHGVRACGIACDVASPDSVSSMIAESVERMGGIHILHNNAATKSRDREAFFAPFEEFSLETWREVMGVNLDGMFLVAQAVGKQMIAQAEGGSVIQTASIYGVVAPDSRIYSGSEYLGRPINTPAVYAVSKAGVIGLSRYLATYWASHGIRVNTLSPGGVESGQNDTFREAYGARVPLGRMGQPDEMCGALVYLASDASRYVTGQNIIVDGGLSVW